MTSKIRLLIGGAVVVMALLIFIQLRFLGNTRHLYERQSISDIRREMELVEKDIDIESRRKELIGKVEKIVLNIPDTNNIHPALSSLYDTALVSGIDSITNTKPVSRRFGAHYNTVVTHITIKLERFGDNEISLKNIPWIGITSDKNAHDYNNKSFDKTTKDSLGRAVYIKIYTRTFYTITKRNKGLLTMLTGLIIFSVILILGIISLFYISIRSFIKQKKVADAKTDFVNNITHEFKTPLTILDIAAASLKKKEASLDLESQDILSTIERQSKRLNALTKRAIEFSKSDSDISLHKTEIDITHHISNIVVDFQKARPGISVNTTIDLDNLMIHADAELLTTAINNVLDNAVKYGGKEISIRAIRRDPGFSISIQDDGIGIEEKKKKHIFDKFYRIEAGDIHNTKGLGLGLFYAKQVVKAHGGDISVESSPGKGSIFTFFFPIK